MEDEIITEKDIIQAEFKAECEKEEKQLKFLEEKTSIKEILNNIDNAITNFSKDADEFIEKYKEKEK